jgi:ubiquinone/menaquinone biosynthesis C-methylase UbiE
MNEPGMPLKPSTGSIEWNLWTWDDPDSWIRDGDGWTFHARSCGQPYSDWKRSVVNNLLDPFLHSDVRVLEIAPGHGRWTEFMIGQVQKLMVVDLCPTCIETCRKRFEQHNPEIDFFCNDGRSLPLENESVDLVWSFAGFVHIDQNDTRTYLKEMARVLAPGGRLVIHHAGWPQWTIRMQVLARLLGERRRNVTRMLAQGTLRDRGQRTPMSAKLFRSLAAREGLLIDQQIRSWGDNAQFGLAFKDVISIGTKPPSIGAGLIDEQASAAR